MEQQPIRPTKKQRELLAFVSQFIAEHGYSPSYREIMQGLSYGSVATVALHVQSLIKRGHLRKRDYSARSLEVVHPDERSSITTNQIKPNEEKWFIDKVEHLFRKAEHEAAVITQEQLHDLYVLVETLNILDMQAAAQSFLPRLAACRKQVPDSKV